MKILSTKMLCLTYRVALFAQMGLLASLCGAPCRVQAQTAAQMEYERQQREYWLQQEQQRQEQQRQQQLMNDNARRQQEEGNRFNVPPGGQGGGTRAPQGATGGVPAGTDVRAIWQRRPPLPPERNPLLGRWNPQGADPAASNATPAGDMSKLFGAEFANMTKSIVGGTLQSVCDSMFGRGIIEFRPRTLVAIGRDGSESVLNHVEYRGGGDRVAVLPQDPGSVGVMVFDFNGRDRIIAAGVGCVMARTGSAATGGPARASEVLAPSVAGSATGAVLSLAVGFSPSPGSFTPIAGRSLWVLKDSVDVALLKGGLRSSPDGTVVKNWERACESRLPACQQGLQALVADSAGVTKTDASGRAQTQPLRAGRYYIFSPVQFDNRQMMWNVPIDLKAGTNSLTLDQRNARPVE